MGRLNSIKLEQVELVVKAVKRLFKGNEDVQSIIKNGHMSIDIDSKYMLESITFEFYDSIEISEHKLEYIPEHGSSRVIATYSSLAELPKLKKSDLGI